MHIPFSFHSVMLPPEVVESFCLNLCIDIYHEFSVESIKSEQVVEVSLPDYEIVRVEVFAPYRLVGMFITSLFTCCKAKLYPSWPFQNMRGYCSES